MHAPRRCIMCCALAGLSNQLVLETARLPVFLPVQDGFVGVHPVHEMCSDDTSQPQNQ